MNGMFDTNASEVNLQSLVSRPFNFQLPSQRNFNWCPKMKQLPTILILFWGIWLNSCNGIHDRGYKYKDHEWNGGAGGVGDGGVRVLRFGESFAFESFPSKSAGAR